MKDLIKEIAKDIVKEIEDGVSEAYNSELNFNNADVKSGQRCYTEDEIREMLGIALLEV